MFNEASQHQSLADSIVDVWRRDGSESFEKVVQEPITSGLEMLNFEIDADCNFYFEAEPIEASLIEVGIELSTKPTVIAADRETVSFTLEVNAVVDIGVEFTFFTLFDLDDDWKEIGRDSIYQTFDETIPILFVAERDISNGVKLLKVEASREPILANFGRIEAFAGEDPSFEKY